VDHDVAVIDRLRAQRRGPEKTTMFTDRNQDAKTGQPATETGNGSIMLYFPAFSPSNEGFCSLYQR
jgi:hypothetical protein